MNETAELPPEAPERPTPQRPEPATAGDRLRFVVQRLRRRALLIAGGTALLLWLSGVALLVLAAALLLGLGAGGWVRTSALVAGALLVPGSAALALRRRDALSRRTLTHGFERRDPRAAGLTTAVELTQRMEAEADPPFSVALARAHVEHTASRLREARLDLAVPWIPLRRASAAAAAAIALLAIAAWLVHPVARGLSRLGERGPAAPAIAALASPITGDISLTYLYPAHTGLPPRTVEGTNGEITAPRGTQVRIQTRADRDLAGAFLEIAGTSQPLAVSGRELSGALLVTGGGTYAFRFEDADHDTIARGPEIPIIATEDAPPTVSITAPVAELTVGEKDRVEVVYEAGDDYGLSRLELVTRIGEGEEQVTALGQAGGKQQSGSTVLDLAPLALHPGDVLTYHVRAFDNDGVAGAKRGQSRVQRLKVYSAAEARREILQRVQQVWERMVSVLGDRITPREGPASVAGEKRVAAGKSADSGVLEVSSALVDISSALRQDRAAPRELRDATGNIGGSLQSMGRGTRLARDRAERFGGSELLRRLDETEGREQKELEKSVLYLEALLDHQRLSELESLGKELAASRRELASLLEQYRTAPTDATKARIQQEIARLKARMAEMMARMTEMARAIQDDFLNEEAMRELGKEKDYLSQLDEVQRLLAQGKVDEAMKALQELGMKLDRMQQQLSDAARGQTENDPALQKLARDLEEYEEELDRVAEKQQQLAKETESLKRQYRQDVQRELQKNGARLVEELQRKIDRAREQLAKIPEGDVPARATDDLGGAEERLQDLKNALSVKDFDAALESAATALGHTQGLEETLRSDAQSAERFGYDDPAKLRAAAERAGKATPLVRDVKEQLERMFPDPSRNMGTAQRQQMRRMAEQQAQLGERMQRLQQKADEIAQQAPIFDEGARSSMEGARGSMQDAEGKLRNTDPGGALASERAAGEKLQSLRDGLEQAKQRARQNGGSGSGFPFPLASSPDGEGEGRDVRDDEKVAIPSADQYKVPDEFRKDIMDAMKQQAPESFKEQVKSYYEEIVK